MGVIVKPFTFAAGGTVTHSDWNSNFDLIYNEFNGSIDDANIKAGANINGSKLLNASITGAKLAATTIQDSHLDYASIRVIRSGPQLGGANGTRLARGGKPYTLVAGSVTVTITFGADADDGDPAFTATPRVVCQVENASANTYAWHLQSVNNTTAVVLINSSSGADVSSGTLHWHAVGDV